MSKKPKIIYEPHPVTPERKAELRGQGYTIVDAVFAPAGAKIVDTEQLRDDGPTVAEYVAAGYPAATYPPKGYASRSTPEEIAQAVAAQAGAGNSGASDAELTDDELRAAIEAASGKAPHHKAGRAKLLEQYAALAGAGDA